MKSFRLCLSLLAALLTNLSAQSTFSESFTGTTASGWEFGGSTGSTNPYLTANTIDTAGTGWLRLTESAGNQATYALLDTQIFSVNAQISITMDYAFYNGSGADGITFFLVDGSTTASSFDVGSYGGSMGYAQRTGEGGMVGGYLGFALDNYGNYSNASEGRNGGITNDGTLYPNRVAVRGPESSNFEFIKASAALPQQMDFPTATTRPDQTGADFRSFQIVLDANNQLEVFMKFGYSGSYTSVFTADLSAYDRPETFKLGFTGATGGSTEIHEVRNLSVTTTPWSTGSGAYEWDNNAPGTGSTAWGATPAAANSNWYSSVSGDDNKTPTADSDVLFGNKPTNNGTTNTQQVDLGANVEVRNMTFDTGINYSIGTVGDTRTITFGDTGKAGLPSINVNDYNGAYARHKINTNITLAEELRINNYSFSTLCLNGTLTTSGNDITVNGYGAVNFNGDIVGSGDLEKNGRGIVTINNDNSNDPDGGGPLTAWSGDVVINQGMVVVTASGALGSTGGDTTVNNGGTLAFRGGVTYSTTEAVIISGRGIERGTNQSAGAIYNDGGTNSFAGTVTLAANAAVGSRDGVLTLSGVIGQSGGARSLTKVGDGVVNLTNGGNSYTGATVVEAGVLRISGDVNALSGGFVTGAPSGGNLTLGGGVLEIGQNSGGTATLATFSRQLGASADQVQWTGDGGFSAFGSDATVTLTNSGGTANGQLTWSAGSFVPTGNALLLSSNYSNATVTLTNAINLGTAQREVRVANGSAAVDGVLSGNLTGTSGGLVKTGNGTLSLTGTNGYSGNTRIEGGALRTTVSGLSGGYATDNTGNDYGAVDLAGGVLELADNTTFSRSLGIGEEQIFWSGDGGFAAGGGDRTVTLSGGAALTWGSGSFVSNGNSLLFGSTSSANTLAFTNAIDLGASGTRTIRTILGTSGSVASGTLSSAVSGAADLAVIGTGRLDMTADNTHTGAVTVAGSELRLSGSGDLAQSSGFTVSQGGTLSLDNTGTNLGDRINNGVTLSGGTLNLYGRTGDNDTTETIGTITLGGGANTINVARGDANGSAQLTIGGFTRSGGATVDFTTINVSGGAGGALGSTGDNPRIVGVNNGAISNTNGIIGGWATVGDNWAYEISDAQGIGALASYETSTTSGNWASTENVSIGGNSTVNGNRTANSFRLDGASAGRTLDLDNNATNRTLTLNSGGILSVGANTNIIRADNAGSILRAGGSSDLFVHTQGSDNVLQINAQIANNSGGNGLVKAGDGTLRLGGSMANTFTGTTYVNAGRLELAKDAGVTAIAGALIVGDGRGADTVRFINNEQLANTSDVTLRGGLTGASATTANQATLDINGTTQTFDQLTIEGNSVIDFSGGDPCAPTFLNISDINFVGDATLTIKNWVEFTDFFLVKDTATIDFSRITFEGYGGQAQWQDYSTGWKQITPVPEPSTYGAIFIGGAVAFTLLRRRRRA